MITLIRQENIKIGLLEALGEMGLRGANTWKRKFKEVMDLNSASLTSECSLLGRVVIPVPTGSITHLI